MIQAPCTVAIKFEGDDGEPQKTISIRSPSGISETYPYYKDGDTVKGELVISPNIGKTVDHQGLKIELVGQIEVYYDRGNFYDFVALVREVEGPSEIKEEIKYPFEFPNVEMVNETYSGINVRVKYAIRFTMVRPYRGSLVKEFPFVVRNAIIVPEINNSIKMEVGIEDCLHIEFEYKKSKYHLKDVLVGKIYFLLVRIKLKHMELEIRRRETTGAGANQFNETETMAKYEVMDGAPVKGECVPIRLFLSAYDLTPTYKNINNKFSVKYFLNLVLVDEEDRRYFKQQEIQLYRNEL